MARTPNVTDFTVPVEGIGSFTFGRRKMADEIKIQVAYARMIEGVEPTQWLSLVSGWLSALMILTVRAPEGWDLEELDPLDNDTYAKLKSVYDALTLKEQSFRRSNGETSKGERAGTGGDNPILVSEEVPASTN